MPCVVHGGRLQQARRRYPGAAAPFLDLSTGINPDAYPFAPPPPNAWRRLPEPEDVAALEAAAARAYGVADPACVVAAPGTQALIQLVPRLVRLPSVAVPAPTYGEHAAAWSAAGTRLDPDSPHGLVRCNPNNPDGARHDPAALLSQPRELLLVDEAYMDFEPPGLSLAPLVPSPGLLVLRSFGKAYGLAGLRLGFALTDAGLATRIREALGPWAIPGPAIAIGRAALADAAWLAGAGARARARSARLDAVLVSAGLRLLGGTALFRLASVGDAAAWSERLGRAGILVRTFADEPGWIRFGHPADDAGFDRLRVALLR